MRPAAAVLAFLMPLSAAATSIEYVSDRRFLGVSADYCDDFDCYHHVSGAYEPPMPFAEHWYSSTCWEEACGSIESTLAQDEMAYAGTSGSFSTYYRSATVYPVFRMVFEVSADVSFSLSGVGSVQLGYYSPSDISEFFEVSGAEYETTGLLEAGVAYHLRATGTGQMRFALVEVPEPGSALLLLIGLVGMRSLGLALAGTAPRQLTPSGGVHHAPPACSRTRSR